MTEPHDTVAAEIAAELELTLPKAAERLAEKLRHVKTLNADLARLGLVRRLAAPENDENDATVHDICGISGVGILAPEHSVASSWTTVHAHRLRMAQRSILDASEQVRVHIGSGSESGQRLLWKQTQHLFEMIGELARQPEPPRIILLDQPILMSRGRETRKLIEEVQEEWLEWWRWSTTFGGATYRSVFRSRPMASSTSQAL